MRKTSAWKALIVATPLLVGASLRQAPITIGETQITNNYPEGITFAVDAASAAGDVTAVELLVRLRGDSSTTNLPAEFTPGAHVRASVVWKTRARGVPPGAVAEYRWRVRDAAGNMLESEPTTIDVVDSRFRWQTLANDEIGLWWYDGDAAFGREVFDAAVRSLAEMRRSSEADLTQPLHIVLYANQEDFTSWHEHVEDWVAGQAYTDLGLTVQIVPPDSSQRWIEDVIPHEVAHLFFYQATYTAVGESPPSWLDEGYAGYHEFGSPEWALQNVQAAAADGTLVPLRLATGSFGVDDERVGLLYDESLSAVTFLYERWGEAGVAQLLEAFHQGADLDGALQQVTGLDFEGFQRAWWEWLGGAPGAYPTAVSWPPPTPESGAATTTPVPPTLQPTAAEAQPQPGAWPFACVPAGALVFAVGGVGAARRRRR